MKNISDETELLGAPFITYPIQLGGGVFRAPIIYVIHVA